MDLPVNDSDEINEWLREQNEKKKKGNQGLPDVNILYIGVGILLLAIIIWIAWSIWEYNKEEKPVVEHMLNPENTITARGATPSKEPQSDNSSSPSQNGPKDNRSPSQPSHSNPSHSSQPSHSSARYHSSSHSTSRKSPSSVRYHSSSESHSNPSQPSHSSARYHSSSHSTSRKSPSTSYRSNSHRSPSRNRSDKLPTDGLPRRTPPSLSKPPSVQRAATALPGRAP